MILVPIILTLTFWSRCLCPVENAKLGMKFLTIIVYLSWLRHSSWGQIGKYPLKTIRSVDFEIVYRFGWQNCWASLWQWGIHKDYSLKTWQFNSKSLHWSSSFYFILSQSWAAFFFWGQTTSIWWLHRCLRRWLHRLVLWSKLWWHLH